VAKSPFFSRIREQVLQLTAAVPEGHVCTYQSIGEYLDVMPRHVAYILSRLEDHEKFVYPWYRVVSADGSLGALKRNPDGSSQAELLRAEGLPVNASKVGPNCEQLFLPAEKLASGLARQKCPTDAPPAKRRSTRTARAR